MNAPILGHPSHALIMTPHRNDDFEFQSLRSFDIPERHADRNEKKQEVTVTVTTLPFQQ
jgi:hypothetical protein